MGNAKKFISPILIALLAITLVGCEALGLVDSLQDEPVTISEITVTAPVIGENPVARVAETDQFTGTVTWDPAHDTFAHGHNYSAEISLVPKDGFTLRGVPANFFTVAGADTAHAANPAIITAIFPAIEAPADDPPADDAHAVTGRSVIPGVTPPVLGATPVSSVTETDYFTGTVEWIPSHEEFKADTSYTARISLQPKSRFDMATVPANYFTVAGAEVTHNAEPAVISAVFPKTWIAISGMSPADGASTPNMRPTLSWNVIEDAASYEVQIADSEAGVTSATVIQTQAPSYPFTSDLAIGDSRYWRVRAKDQNGVYGAWSETASFSIRAYEVGDTGPAGGIVFHDKGNDSRGLRYREAWTADESGSYSWNPAWQVARNANHGGFNDWFLPSKDELFLMYHQRELIGNFASNYYWSSSEINISNAWFHNFDGFRWHHDKSQRFRVRVVRAF